MPKNQKQQDSDFESVESGSQIDIQEQIEEAIKQLTSIEDKVQSVAINYYMQQKRKLDEELQLKKAQVECKMRNVYNPQVQQIQALIEGEAITDIDYEFMKGLEGMFKDTELQQFQKIVNGEIKLENQGKQIQGYWLRCMKNSDIIAEQIHGEDEQVLKLLHKIQSKGNEDNTKLTLSFHFKPNKWFENAKLQKTFTIKDGEATKSQGDEIQWKQGMNYTQQVVKKGKKKRGKKQKEQIIKLPSFFHFFASISSEREDNNDNLDDQQWDDLMEDLEVQYEISQHFDQDFIPKSLEFYLNCNKGDSPLDEQGDHDAEGVIEEGQVQKEDDSDGQK